MAQQPEKFSTKNEISYAEHLCKELETRVLELEKKIQDGDTKLKNDRSKQAMIIELKEVQKLLKKHTDQLEHLRTHESGPLKVIMAITLVIFVVWMIFVLKNNNWGKPSEDIGVM